MDSARHNFWRLEYKNDNNDKHHELVTVPVLNDNNKKRHLGTFQRHYQRKKNSNLVQQKSQSPEHEHEPEASTHNSEPRHNSQETNLDNLHIALRKGKRSFVKYPIAQLVPTKKLCSAIEPYSTIDSIRFPANVAKVQEALHVKN